MTGSGRYVQVVALAGRFEKTQVAAVAGRLAAVRRIRLESDEAAPIEASETELLIARGQSQAEFEATVPRLPRLRRGHTASSGVDRCFLIPPVTEGRVRLTRAAHACAEPIAEYVLGLALALRKQLASLISAQRERRWQRPTAGTLAGARVGIVGAGAVGRASARRFRALRAGTVGLKRRPEALPEFEREPQLEESPLWDLPSVIVSPHCAAAVPAVWEAVVEEFLANLHRWWASRPLAHEVDAADAAY